MELQDFSNEELIDFVSSQIATPKLLQEVSDFSDAKKWRKVVDEMLKPVATVYRLAVLHMQVLNGGFIQYFDNGYGIFAYETLEDLQTIQAKETYQILKRCLEIINPKNYTDENFLNLVYQREYDSNYDSLSQQLNQLDDQYYGLVQAESLDELLGEYLRRHLDELKQFSK